MLQKYTIYPFMHLPNCDLHEQGVQDLTCEDTHKKIISLRVYFAITILNFIFIVFTTLYFVYRILSANGLSRPLDMLHVTNETISKRWRMYSLKKRDVFGTVLGAIGHLIFSTTVFIYQVFVNAFSCDIFLWGPMVGFFIWMYALVWRAYRLHLMIRVNELQERYHDRNTASYNSRGEKISLKTTTASIKRSDKDYNWFMRHKVALNFSSRHHIFLCSFFFIIIVCVIALAESLGIWYDGQPRCEIYMGNYMVSAFAAFFFLVIIPFIFWLLRNDGDAHGMRKEIWVTVAVGIPCSILCIIWQIAFDYPTSKNPANVRGLFGPCNWLVILTTTNHVTTTIMPIFKTLSIDDKNSTISYHKRRDQWITKLKKKLAHENLPRFSQTSQSSTFESSNRNSDPYYWELTVDSLYRALNDPGQIDILKNWAVKDFSVENILFYDRYLNLVKQLIQSRDEDSISSNQSSILTKPSEELLNIPFNPDQIPQLVDIYNTFIVDEAPLQVNISYKAKSATDEIMRPLAREYRNNLATPGPSAQSGAPYFLQTIAEETCDKTFGHPTSNTYKTESCEDLTTSTTDADPVIVVQEKPELTTIKSKDALNPPTLQVFEQVRKEVFWNIFSGLFPKVVEAHNTHFND